jgi:hypothetical protein
MIPGMHADEDPTGVSAKEPGVLIFGPRRREKNTMRMAGISAATHPEAALALQQGALRQDIEKC